MSHTEGEKLIIVATLDSVKAGQEFETIPPHMSIVGRFALQENRRYRLLETLDNLFDGQPTSVFDESPDKPVIGGVWGRFDTEDGRKSGRALRNVSDAPGVGVDAVIRSLAAVDLETYVSPGSEHNAMRTFKDEFNPHIINTRERQIWAGERVLFSSVALIGLGAALENKRVLESIQLGKTE